jgi:outer membrane protein assembly complex protein YaeT
MGSVVPSLRGKQELKSKESASRPRRRGYSCLPACILAFALAQASLASGLTWSQTQDDALLAAPSSGRTALAAEASAGAAAPAWNAPTTLSEWEGLPVLHIGFEGIDASRLAKLTDRISQSVGAPLNRKDVQKSLRQLFATGVFETIEVEGTRQAGGVDLVFHGTPRTFIGRVSVEGAKGTTLNAQLQRASQLNAGARFTPAKMSRALEQMRQTMADNGFHESVLTPVLTPNPQEQLVDIVIHVVSGPQARVGAVDVTGDLGMSLSEFRASAHLHAGSHVDHDTTERALSAIMKHYHERDHLEAEIKLASQQYVEGSKKSNFVFTATQGRLVKVFVEGANLSFARVRHVIPLFEEGAVDDDLLNEGERLRDYFQRLGYFDVKVDHEQQASSADLLTILYHVHLGARRRLDRVSVDGNRYFDSATLKDNLGVRPASGLDHHGLYSQNLLTADVRALQALYQNNGFSQVKITPETRALAIGTPPSATDKTRIEVVYHISEGAQQRVASVRIEGAEHSDAAKLVMQLNTTPGQLLSPQNLTGDRDTLLTDYLNLGFDNARIEIQQQATPEDPNKVDVVFQVREGQQLFVRKVLLTGLQFTRPETVAKAITLHPGDPLNETALAETQRNLYEFALFNEVDTAIENPTGAEAAKTVLLQASEARRWALNYGGGLEVQTGTPQNNCQGAAVRNIFCSANTKASVSPRVLLDITRNNLAGREQSASLRATYGMLEQKIDLLYQVPHFEGRRNMGLTLSGGYANSLDVTTYVASKLEAGTRWTQHFDAPSSFLSKANTLIYEFNFRRIKVDANNLQVAQKEITPLSTAERVAGPALTWIRDTRDSPLDAHRGIYTSFQEFLSSASFGAQVQFNRLDLSNSSFYSFGKGRFVLARNTRYGQERAFGTASEELIPLPERLYAGGATSLRGFSLNAAGPRDPETGYPIGGAGTLINSTELRLPPPNLPVLGNNISLVLFHDMGNVFTNASDAWASALRFYQPDRDACKNPQPMPPGTPYSSTGLKSPCNFNYFSHAPGIGMRYHTPVGPVRLDFSYNLNTPIYPVVYNYSNFTAPPTVGEASHFNFFFSLGQTF